MKIFMIVTRVEIFGIYIQNSYKQVMKIFMIVTRVEIFELMNSLRSSTYQIYL